MGAVDPETGLLGLEGIKPSRGYPNPEGGTQVGVEPCLNGGSSNLTCAEGKESPREEPVAAASG
jgi:hypothetical protein